MTMKTPHTATDFARAASQPFTLADALTDVADLAAEIARYGGRLEDWVASIDAIDRWVPEGFRTSVKLLAARVARFLTPSEAVVVGWALDHVCAGDAYATRELAGRFASAVARNRMVHVIRARRDAARWVTLCEAVARGNATIKQMNLARDLVSEAA